MRQSLQIYEHHAVEAERALLEAFKVDPAAMDRLYPHLRKAHLPRLKPDASLNAAFTTVEAALSRAALPKSPTRTPTPMPVFSPNHPEHVRLNPDEELRPYIRDSAESGLIGLPPLLAEYFGVAEAARAAESRLRKQEQRAVVYPRAAAVPQIGPQPWKPVTPRS
ncbi:hypothetical protein [Variovorax paradoxus]|uniref:hypothetical protein n=1 Tax=Variovorax paradoxus TaxID=34073 RepID=UPI00247FAAE0|nr:hypothetical protein [Variovorax paradoxus]WGT66017.1 hypothetical protein QHG62_11970 [Variovorax paradoxus]